MLACSIKKLKFSGLTGKKQKKDQTRARVSRREFLSPRGTGKSRKGLNGSGAAKRCDNTIFCNQDFTNKRCIYVSIPTDEIFVKVEFEEILEKRTDGLALPDKRREWEVPGIRRAELV
jgi:hypothetical protein